jgi:CRP-like cAMP-binding protein
MTCHGQQIVFNQGEKGDMMYVIISGSVTVRRKSDEYGGLNVVIRTLKDGDCFGELSIISSESEQSEPATRTATVMVSEMTDLLTVPKVEYHEILLNQIKTTVDSRIAFFGELSFFQGVEI